MFTDHSALVNIFTGPPPTAKLARWLEKLSDFDMEVVHIKGIANRVADALSRQSWSIPETPAASSTSESSLEQLHSYSFIESSTPEKGGDVVKPTTSSAAVPTNINA